MNLIYYWIGALLAFAGGAFSFYFHGVYKQWLHHDQWWIPKVCRMESQTCTSIAETKYGHIGGLPNALTGFAIMVIYIGVLIGVPLGFVLPNIPFIIGLFTVGIGLYLIYGLFRLKVICPVCIAVHTLNCIILLLQIMALI